MCAVSGLVVCTLAFSVVGFSECIAGEARLATPEKLGEALFHDNNLSRNRSQSCSTCHMPDRAFADPSSFAVSRGDNPTLFGSRNAPSIAYSALSPEFQKNDAGEWLGGQFWDGRASSLPDQAGGPILNPEEMAMPDKISVLDRINERSDYRSALKILYGQNVLTEPERAFSAVTNALASFEQTNVLSPFDSRYDRYLKGEEKFTDQEELGRTLFFSKQFTNCNICHDVKSRDGGYEMSTFTSYKYFNIGVPVNETIRQLKKLTAGFRDLGLASHTNVGDGAVSEGKFRVPTLRNVAITAPYMHNGIFKELRTVLQFYNHYNSTNQKRQINPETGKTWDLPEVAENLARTELEIGPALDDKRIDALIAFMKTLTDKRYEGLLK